MKDTITVRLARSDAQLVGSTLRCLARTKAPQPEVAELLARVGKVLATAADTVRERGRGGVL